MYVHLKITGEALASPQNKPWDITQVMQCAEQLADLHQLGQDAGFNVMVVPGGGNHMRGADFERPWLRDGKEVPEALSRAADQTGRWGTFDNAVMLAGALASMGVNHAVHVAEGMKLTDSTGGEYPASTPENIEAAYELGQLVLVGGGIGQNSFRGERCTTDTAVVMLAERQARRGDRPALALKATGVNGVFNRNPLVPGPEPAMIHDEIYAAQMLEDPKRFAVIDPASMLVLAEAPEGLGLIVYNRRFSPVQAIRSVLEGMPIGTIVRSGPISVADFASL